MLAKAAKIHIRDKATLLHYSTQVTEYMSLYEALLISGEDQMLFSALQDDWNQYRTAEEEIIALAEQGKYEEAVICYTDSVAPIYMSVQASAV